MNRIQTLGKLGLYQTKVFLSSYCKLKTGKYTSDDVEGLYKGKYLYKWQYKILLKQKF